MKSKILICSCIHKAQDKIYGNQKRLHSFGLKAYNGNEGWRCTVCKNVKRA